MRVGLIIYGDLDFTSGGFMYDRRLVDYLQNQGEEVEIISLPWRTYLQHIGDNFSIALLRRLQSLSVDVLLQDELNHASLFWLNRRLKKRKSIPIVSIVHHLRVREGHTGVLHQAYRLVERAYLRSIDATICVSATTQQDVAALAGNRRPSIICPPAGNRWAAPPDAAAVRARCQHPGALNLLFLGNVIPRKGLHILLKAMAHLPPSSCNLRVVGNLGLDSHYVTGIQQLIQDLGLVSRVRLLGSLPADGVEAELRQADVMAVPSSYEGFGIVYLEGLGFGLPGIAGQRGAAGEILRAGETGFLVDTADPLKVAAAISRLADDRAMLLRMSLAALQAYPNFAAWDTSMTRAHKFLTELVRDAIIS